MSNSNDDSKKDFKVVDVKPEDFQKTSSKKEGSAWVANDRWPGSASKTEANARAKSAWNISDSWPGSASKTEAEARAKSAWNISDTWPGSAAFSDDGSDKEG